MRGAKVGALWVVEHIGLGHEVLCDRPVFGFVPCRGALFGDYSGHLPVIPQAVVHPVVEPCCLRHSF